MAKTKSKDKYEARHLRNLTAYERQIDDIYREAVKEAASISSLVGGTSGDKAFSFKDYPITQHRVNKLLQGLKNSLYGTIVNAVRSEWTLANNKNNELCNQVFGSNVGMLSEAQYRRYYSTNPKALEAFIARKQQGLNLSDRVWNYTNQFKAEIEMGLDLGLRDGLSADEMSRQLRQYLRYPDKLFRRVRDEHGQLHLSKAAAAFHPGQGVYRSSYKNARRLAATESNIAYRTADYDRYQNLDFVVGIEVHLSNNHTLNGKPFEDICDQLKGRYPKDFKFTGWHPLCRCHVTSVLKTREELFADNERILRGEPVSTESVNSVDDVPEAFKDWVRDNEGRLANAKSVPYFMRDNSRYVMQSLETTQSGKAYVAEQAVKVFTAANMKDVENNGWRINCYNDDDWNRIGAKIDWDNLKTSIEEIGAREGFTIEDWFINVGKNNLSFNIKCMDYEKFEAIFCLKRDFYINDERIEVHHDLFDIAKNLQGKGISKEVFRVLYEDYKRIGVTDITVYANIDVGGYTWGRYGFCASKTSAKLAIRYAKNQEYLQEAIDLIDDWYSNNNKSDNDLFPMRLLTEQPWGKELLLGTSWEGSIDLLNDEARKQFEDYLYR